MAEEKVEVTSELPEMGFSGHLEELRKRLIYSVIALIIGCIVTGIFIDSIMNIVLLGPAISSKLELQNRKPFGQAFLYFKVIFIVGIIITTPFILYQLWKFIEPGLYEKERRWAKSITFFTTVCFFAGISFAYFVMIPSMLTFSASFGSQNIKNFIDVDELLSFMTTTLLAAGLIFELPMITFVLTKVGIVTPTMMRKYRRHSIVGILIIAAVMTPSPDPFNQMIFAIPLYILFELSIWVSSLATNQRTKESKEQ